MIKTEKTYTNLAIGNNGEVLQDIHLPSRNIAIYKRSVASLQPVLTDFAEKSIAFQASGTVEEILAMLQDHLSSHLTNYAPLFDDVSALLELFKKTSRASSFRVLLSTVSTNMCRRFHTDIQDLRMLCTYVGPGTLWVPDIFASKKAYQDGRHNEDIVAEESEVQQVRTGDVVILKGALYPDANPILHRSPTIEEMGEKRLLLRIDTNAAQNLWS